MLKVKEDALSFIVTATPTGSEPQTFDFPISASNAEITGSTIPIVSGVNTQKSIEYANGIVQYVKDGINKFGTNFDIEIDEEEKIDRGWFSHMDVDLRFDAGGWGIKVKGTPIKETKTKKTTIKVRRS